MPELFGSPYVLPAVIIVVLLLLLLLLLLISTRRRKDQTQSSKHDKPKEIKEAPEAPALLSATPGARSRTAAEGPKPVERPSIDPVVAVVNSILEGWGDLTAEDFNRLRVFRSERVVAAIVAAELPKNLKNSEHARSRLSQLRRYAANLQEAGEGEQPAAEPAHAAPEPAHAAPEPAHAQEEAESPLAEPLPDLAEIASTSPTDVFRTVRTAEEVMSLPAVEQASMIAFLQPLELRKVFQSTNDSELKKAIIDTLEHIGDTSALGILQQCLEDLDPAIQLYAADAAERLLGNLQNGPFQFP